MPRLSYRQFKDQEVLAIGMHGPFFHIIRVFFSTETIESVQVGKNPGPYTFDVKLSKEYNLLEKSDCLEAFRGLVGMFRYLLSGEANVGAMQVAFSLPQLPKEVVTVQMLIFKLAALHFLHKNEKNIYNHTGMLRVHPAGSPGDSDPLFP